MDFCTNEEFVRFCPFFEDALRNDATVLVKYWLSVSDEEGQSAVG